MTLTNVEHERDQYRDRAHTAEVLLDHIYPQLYTSLQHQPSCTTDEYPYPQVIEYANGCRACIILAMIRHWFDQTEPHLTIETIDNTLTPHRHL